MAKKSKKNDATRTDAKPAADLPGEGTQEDEEGSDEVTTSGGLVTSALPPSASPLAREQERDLEIGLTLSGLLVGALTGLGQVPLGAQDGNIPAAVLGALLGALLGLNVGRSLFFEVHQQWTLWSAMAVLGLFGYTLGASFAGLLAGLVGALVAVGAVSVGMFTVHKRRVIALATHRRS